MTVDSFFDHFSDLADGELHKLRRTPRLDQFPPQPSFYVDLTNRLFPGYPHDWERRQRFVSILREFLYHDGRTFDALLAVADEAVRSPDEYDSNGVNSLAGISCYLHMNRPVPFSDEELLARLARFSQTAALAHNARNCRDAILERRPDLRDESD
jgi:hypothetical protein